MERPLGEGGRRRPSSNHRPQATEKEENDGLKVACLLESCGHIRRFGRTIVLDCGRAHLQIANATIDAIMTGTAALRCTLG